LVGKLVQIVERASDRCVLTAGNFTGTGIEFSGADGGICVPDNM